MVKIVKTETSRRMAALTADLLGPYGPSGAARPAPSTVATVTDRRAFVQLSPSADASATGYEWQVDDAGKARPSRRA